MENKENSTAQQSTVPSATPKVHAPEQEHTSNIQETHPVVAVNATPNTSPQTAIAERQTEEKDAAEKSNVDESGNATSETPVEVVTNNDTDDTAEEPAPPPEPTLLQRFWRQLVRIPLYIRWRISYILRSEHFLTSTLLGIMILFFASFFVWAYHCTIEKTVKAQGVVMAIIENQVVSHLEGGVIKSIYVAHGDQVIANQPLMEVVNMDMRRDKDRYLVKKQFTEAVLQRLYAERDGVDLVLTEEEIKNNQDLVQQYEVQMQNKETLHDTITILKTQKDKLLAEKATKIAQRDNLMIELELAAQQVAMLEPLIKEGIGSKQNLLQRQAEMARLKTSVDDLTHGILTLDINIREAEEKIVEEQSIFLKKVQEEIATNTNELSAILSELDAIDSSIQRSTLRAPISGTIHKMYTSTIGGIVRAGDPLIEIVPDATSIRIEAKVQPQDRTNIYNHQEAKVRPTSYSFSLDTMLLVDITSISAQTFYDDQTRTHYYKVFLQSQKLPETEEEKERYAMFMPGMIVEVNILSGEESLLHYLFTPIIRGLDNALTEQSTR